MVLNILRDTGLSIAFIYNRMTSRRLVLIYTVCSDQSVPILEVDTVTLLHKINDSLLYATQSV